MRTCTKCGTKLPGFSPAGLCRKCFLQEGLTSLPKETIRLELTGVPDAEGPNPVGAPPQAEIAFTVSS